MSFENVLTFVCIDLNLAFISHYVFLGARGERRRGRGIIALLREPSSGQRWKWGEFGSQPFSRPRLLFPRPSTPKSLVSYFVPGEREREVGRIGGHTPDDVKPQWLLCSPLDRARAIFKHLISACVIEEGGVGKPLIKWISPSDSS